VSLEDTARLLGLPKSWLYKQTGARQIPFSKVGHYCMFRLSEVEAYLQSRRVEPSNG
jgi:excisionase family DNA binding protein